MIINISSRPSSIELQDITEYHFVVGRERGSGRLFFVTRDGSFDSPGRFAARVFMPRDLTICNGKGARADTVQELVEKITSVEWHAFKTLTEVGQFFIDTDQGRYE